MVKEGEEVEGGRVRGVQPEAMMALECVSEMYVYTCIHTHANTRIHIHADTYTHTHTHTHTLSYLRLLPSANAIVLLSASTSEILAPSSTSMRFRV